MNSKDAALLALVGFIFLLINPIIGILYCILIVFLARPDLFNRIGTSKQTEQIKQTTSSGYIGKVKDSYKEGNWSVLKNSKKYIRQR